MFMTSFWAVMIVFVVFGTYWGWRNVLGPYVWPAIVALFKASRVIWWTGFTFFILCLAPVTWRMWGSVPTNAWFANHLDYENNVDPEGDWTKDWRYKCTKNVKDQPWSGGCSNWKGDHIWCGETWWCQEYKAGRIKPGYHRLPTLTIIIPPILIIAFVLYRRNVNVRKGGGMAPKRRRGKPGPPSLGQNKIILSKARALTPPEPAQPVHGNDATDDGTLMAALVGLGYRKTDIRAVMSKVQGDTLDARLRSALQTLRTAKDA